jgi:hypothetical protein
MKGGKLGHRTARPSKLRSCGLPLPTIGKPRKLMKAWEDETERLMDLEVAHKS